VELADLDVAELLHIYRSRQASPTEAVISCLSRIDRIDSKINAVMTLLIERSQHQASESTQRWVSGTARPLEGIPYGLKDIIATADVRTTGGSKLYVSYVPVRSATVAKRLDDAGAILVAKLQTFEFAAGGNSVTCNPWDLTRWAAGSSSGSAAAVAARELPLTVGTDTSGSIIVPAAFCGVVGLRPTFGRISRSGVMPLSWTLDHVGPFTRSAVDAAHALEIMAGHDPHDPSSSKAPVSEYLKLSEGEIRDLRVGVPTDWFYDICDPEVENAARDVVQVLIELGARAVEVQFPSTKIADPHAIELTITHAELASLHEVHSERAHEFGREFAQLLADSQATSASDYIRALRARHILQRDFEHAFEQVDAIVVPGGICTAPRQDHLVAKIGDSEHRLIDVITRSTSIFNMTGIPSLTMPAGFDALSLPIGVQIAARPFDEATALRIARAYQRATDFHRQQPPVLRADGFDTFDVSRLQAMPATIEKPVITELRDRLW
jgi:aspartyl-tRNA(Asn)/glutamyl-tRNA(Gln) amidotransferase subunit A